MGLNAARTTFFFDELDVFRIHQLRVDQEVWSACFGTYNRSSNALEVRFRMRSTNWFVRFVLIDAELAEGRSMCTRYPRTLHCSLVATFCSCLP